VFFLGVFVTNKHNILVCSDFSPASDRALKVAKELSVKSGGNIFLIHVAEIGFYFDLVTQFGQNKEGDDKFKELLHVELHQRLNAQKNKFEVSCKSFVLFESNATQAILQFNEDYAIDLVILGDKSNTGLENFLLGSLARKMAASAKKPVLIVKNERLKGNVAGLVSTSEDVSFVISNTAEMARVLSTQMTIVSLVAKFAYQPYESSMELSDSIVETFKEQTSKTVTRTLEDIQAALGDIDAKVIVSDCYSVDIPNRLVEILNENDVQLAVVRKHHKSIADKIMLGSVSARVIETFAGNVLVLK
jgi:nucleotide-binding universal stress UspA family protein